MREWIAAWAAKLNEREYHAVLTAAILAVAAAAGYTPDEAAVATIVGALAVFIAFIINRTILKKAEMNGTRYIVLAEEKGEGVLVDGQDDPVN